MAPGYVDGTKVAMMFDRIRDMATAETGKPIEEVGAGPIFVAGLVLLLGRLRQMIGG